MGDERETGPLGLKTDDEHDGVFESFAVVARPRLVRALIAVRGVEGAADAAAEALAFAWENWDAVSSMENATGYLYRVAQSRSRPRRTPELPAAGTHDLPEVEPDLIPALLSLPTTQRGAVWLVHACGWSYGDTAEALDMSVSAVGTNLTRGMAALRRRLGVST